MLGVEVSGCRPSVPGTVIVKEDCFMSGLIAIRRAGAGLWLQDKRVKCVYGRQEWGVELAEDPGTVVFSNQKKHALQNQFE